MRGRKPDAAVPCRPLTRDQSVVRANVAKNGSLPMRMSVYRSCRALVVAAGERENEGGRLSQSGPQPDHGRRFRWTKILTRQPAQLSALAIQALVLLFVSGGQGYAQIPSVWMALPSSNSEFETLFAHPASWGNARTHTQTFSIGAGYVRSTSQNQLANRAEWLVREGLKLDVGLPALPVDKHVCGDGVEGMVWPGEALALVRRLRAAGVDVHSFSFDLPLTNGHISHARNACRFSIREVARRLAETMRTLRMAYPDAEFVDVEVPTGIPRQRWVRILSEWLDDLRAEAGEDLAGFVFDVWWESDWQPVVEDSIRILRARGISVGSFLNADRGLGLDASTYPAAVKRNACRMRGLLGSRDFVIIANWMVPGVALLPETNPQSLVTLANWYVRPDACNERTRP